MVTPADILLLAIENWTALGKSVNFSTVVGKLNSPTSYTISDSTSGLSLNVVGTNFAVTNFFGYTLLDQGTINSFTLSLHGATIVKGSKYSLPASSLFTAIENSVLGGNASPLFNLWFSIPTIVSGTAPIVEGNLANLRPYVNIAAIDITSGTVAVSVANFTTYEKLLDKISGGFSISDSSANVHAGLALLEADATHINSIHVTSAAGYVLDVHNSNGS
jgi:hypothetical protein